MVTGVAVAAVVAMAAAMDPMATRAAGEVAA